MSKLSIINDEISDNIEEVVAFLKKNKLHHLELRSFEKENIANIEIAQLKKYAKYLEKHNTSVSCIASPLLKWDKEEKNNIIGSNTSKENNHFYLHSNNSFEKMFEIAEIFGANYIRIFSFLKYNGFSFQDLKKPVSDLIKLAEKYNKILLIENEPVCNVRSIKGLYKFIKYFKSDRIKILFDPGNLYAQSERINYNDLSKISKSIEYVHVKDFSVDKKKYVVLNKGDINYKKLILWLNENVGDNIFYSLETHVSKKNRIATSGKSVDVLKRLLVAESVRYGIVGCGRISKKHAISIKKCNQSKLIGVFDIDSKKGNKICSKYGCENYDNLNDLIDDVDVISVCTPHHTHANIISKILTKGKYCLCEKPGSMSNMDMTMVKRNSNYKENLFVVYQNRYNLPILKLREEIEKNELGKILYISGSVRWFRDADYYSKSSWQGNKEKEGGILFNQGAHMMDLLLSLFPSKKNKIVLSAVRSKLYHKKINTEDIFIAQFMVDKAMINLEVTVSSVPDNLESNLLIIFEKGRAIVGGVSLEKSLRIDFLEKKKSKEINFCANKDVYGMTHHKVISNMTRYIQTGEKDKNLVDYDQACERINLINGLYKIAKR